MRRSDCGPLFRRSKPRPKRTNHNATNNKSTNPKPNPTYPKP